MEDVYEYIDDYMNGLLEGEALERFETEMENNSSLKKAVENYDSAKAISEGLLEVDMMTTLNRLRASENQAAPGDGASIRSMASTELENKSTNPKWTIRKWIAAASFIGVLVFAGWWTMEYNTKSFMMDEIVTEIIDPVDEDSKKSIDTIGKTDFEKGKHYFSRNLFEESIPYFERHVSQNLDQQSQSQGYEWLGVAYVYVERLEDAIEALKKSREESAKRNLELLLTKTK